MTESTQLQTAENNNAGVVKMEPPPPATSTATTSSSSLSSTSANATTAAAAAAAAAAATGTDATSTSSSTSSAASAAAAAAAAAISPAQSLAAAAIAAAAAAAVGGMDCQAAQQQHYALKWNDFQSSILNSFRHLRDEEDFVDVTLACDERSFTAHKVVLSACSPYFRKLLKANPCEHPIVILRDVRADDVENLLSFMYNGEVNVSHEHLPDFLKTAHLLQIRGLADVNGGYPVPKSLSAALTNNNNNNTNNSNNNNNNNNKFGYLPNATAAALNASLAGIGHAALNNNNNNSSNNGSNNNNSHHHNSNSNQSHNSSPFTTPVPLLPPGSNAAAAAALANAAANLSMPGVGAGMGALSGSQQSLTSIGSIGNGNSNSINNNNNNGGSNNNGSNQAPALQELKATSASPANSHWDDLDRKSHLTPPPQKRIKSADLFRAQHGISPERLLIDREFPVAGQHPLTRNRSRDTSKDRDRNMELRESLLGQALENSNGQQQQQQQQQQGNQKHDLGQSAGEDSNSSDTEPSDRGDVQHDGTLDGMDNQRSHSFPSAFLGLQGIPGLLPGPSGMGANDFVSRRSLEMRVRATDPRPCPKCGKIYRSAHTLRTHLEDKHTVCPGYRCVLCGTVAKSRNSLHSHMSRQHRGISTKDLPVLPMPSAFDPELASRLLAKAGVKISPAELRARASPTGGGGGSSGSGGPSKLDLSNVSGGPLDDCEDSDDDPEDLTTGNGLYGSVGSSSAGDLSRYHESLFGNLGHANTTISRIRNEAAAAAAAAAAMGQQQKDLVTGGQIPTSTAAGQSLLDTYLQFITESTFGMGMSQEHAAAAALHAAKMAHLNAMGHGLDKLPPSLLPPQFDLAKMAAASSAPGFPGSPNNNSAGGLTIEPILRARDHQSSSLSPNENGPAGVLTHTGGVNADGADIRRDSSEPMDLGLEHNNQSGSNNDNVNSDAEENYSEDEGVHNT